VMPGRSRIVTVAVCVLGCGVPGCRGLCGGCLHIGIWLLREGSSGRSEVSCGQSCPRGGERDGRPRRQGGGSALERQRGEDRLLRRDLVPEVRRLALGRRPSLRRRSTGCDPPPPSLRAATPCLRSTIAPDATPGRYRFLRRIRVEGRGQVRKMTVARFLVRGNMARPTCICNALIPEKARHR
jgi:hypothetical protein